MSDDALAPDHLFIAMWPITDPHRSTRELVSEAGREMRRLALIHKAELAGRPKWVRRSGADFPGSGGAEEVLVCTVPAVRWVPNEEFDHEGAVA